MIRPRPKGYCSDCHYPSGEDSGLCMAERGGRTCGGVVHPARSPHFWGMCAACTGSGHASRTRCPSCRGAGWLFAMEGD